MPGRLRAGPDLALCLDGDDRRRPFRNPSLRAAMSVRARLQHALAAVFRPFTKVHPQEAATAGLMTVSAFLLLTAYYLLKTVREPLILLQGGADEAARDRLPLLHLEPRRFHSIGEGRRADRPAVLPVGRGVQLHGGRPI